MRGVAKVAHLEVPSLMGGQKEDKHLLDFNSYSLMEKGGTNLNKR